MDSGSYSTEAPPLEPLLYRQYEEQSSLCDAIIRTGLWEKRFHWCVLVASPFFDNVNRNNFLEKQTGIVELNKWPAPVLEMALLFLYGRTPKVTEANSDILMDIAEFLLIPELKVRCIEYLEETKVTLDNCMQLYELSSVYGFSLKKCDDFIKGNLPEVLEQKCMLNTTSELLKQLLADPTLSYVSIQTWFQFLVRWGNKAPGRQDTFVELLNMLDFNECDKEFLNNTVTKEPSVINANEELMERLISVQDDPSDTVLIFSIADSANEFKCFNMRTMNWFRIPLTVDINSEEYSQFPNSPVAGIKSSSSSCILKVAPTYRSFRVYTYDLNNAQYSVAKAVSSDDADGDNHFNLDRYSVGNDTLTAVSRTQIPFGNVFKTVDRNNRSTLYIVKLDEPVPKLHAVLTLKDHSVSALARSNTGVVAMLTCNRENLFIYNDSTAELDCIRLKLDHGIEINFNRVLVAAVEDDFVLHYNNTVICVSKLSGACLEKKYNVKQVTFEKIDKLSEHKYLFDGDRWFRVSFKCYQNNAVNTVEYVDHKELARTENTASLCWEKIPIPSEADVGWSSWMDISVFSVSLQKGIPRCHLNCPHCKMAKRDQAQKSPEIDQLGADYDSDENDEDIDGYSDYGYLPDSYLFGYWYNYNYDSDDDYVDDDDDDDGDDDGGGAGGGGGDDGAGGDVDGGDDDDEWCDISNWS